jgi:glutathione S-transferase
MPRTRPSRVLWLLEEIGAPYELTEIRGADRRSVELLARHPLGRVPVLELGDGTMMFESAAICLQLADLNPDAGLIATPGSPERALVYQWVLFGMTELEAPLFRWIGELNDGVTESPAGNRFNQAAGALQAELGERDWLLGETFTVGDVICASVLEGATRQTCWLTGPGSGPMWSAVRRAPPTRGRKRSGVNSAASRAEQLPPERPLPTEVQCAAGIQGPTPLMRCTA